jgi:F-type H+-transporting ATPase subunit epsilon
MMNTDNTMLLRVVTPRGNVLESPAASVVIWTATGEIEVLPGHAPIVVLLLPGEMRVRDANGAERAFAAGEGFAQIDQKSVTIFSDMAEASEGIILEQEQEAKSRAEKALAAATTLSPEERDEADLALRESVAKIQISLRRKDRARQGVQPA